MLEIDPPAIVPNKLAKTSAEDEPIKTAKGRLVDPLKATVANWVLSPSSARNTVVNVEMSSGRNIFSEVPETTITNQAPDHQSIIQELS